MIEVCGDYPSKSAAIKSVASKLGITSSEQLRTWVRQEVYHLIKVDPRTGEIAS